MEQAHHNARKENLWFFCKRERLAKGRRYKLKKKSFVGQPPYKPYRAPSTAKKVFLVGLEGPNTFREATWSPRDMFELFVWCALLTICDSSCEP